MCFFSNATYVYRVESIAEPVNETTVIIDKPLIEFDFDCRSSVLENIVIIVRHASSKYDR